MDQTCWNSCSIMHVVCSTVRQDEVWINEIIHEKMNSKKEKEQGHICLVRDMDAAFALLMLVHYILYWLRM